MRRIVLTVYALLAFAAPAFAVLPSEQLSDPKLEARARHISQELRCVVCQNQTIDDSDAPLAHDLRVILRERLLAGDSDDQAKAYLVKRYGTYVLLKPPFQENTLLLWLGPFFVLGIGGVLVVSYLLGRSRLEAAPQLSTDERARLDDLLKPDAAE
ncbi:MAG TPA: cytochrome c-type biogenesis protein [Rhizomicrobium sp.]|nr:cytochrome c-type biogenesis protein [Rhizomicrobium sp.]